MEPSVILVEPWDDPPSTMRAVHISQMYDYSVGRSFDFTYDVGLPLGELESRFSLKIRNKTVNTDIVATLTLPPYIKAKNGTTFVISPSAITSIELGVDEAFAKKHTASTAQSIQSE
ncbi:MAG: hypothetical protein KY428_09000, partial [Bacteroidetes bacterium]|nr:hypothetical protein [Bacteroidota bacterium]